MNRAIQKHFHRVSASLLQCKGLLSVDSRGAHTMLTRVLVEKVSMPKLQPVAKTATGMSALSIWMKDTLR